MPPLCDDLLELLIILLKTCIQAWQCWHSPIMKNTWKSLLGQPKLISLKNNKIKNIGIIKNTSNVKWFHHMRTKNKNIIQTTLQSVGLHHSFSVCCSAVWNFKCLYYLKQKGEKKDLSASAECMYFPVAKNMMYHRYSFTGLHIVTYGSASSHGLYNVFLQVRIDIAHRECHQDKNLWRGRALIWNITCSEPG